MKNIIQQPIGGDGGKITLGVDGQDLAIKISYPVEKVLEPLKVNFIDKLKAMIPGTWDDVLIDAAWNDAVKSLKDVPA